jgi:hypothetical protein
MTARVDVYAVTTGVSTFFAGLALGGALFGRWVDRLARPLLQRSSAPPFPPLSGWWWKRVTSGGTWAPW